MSHHHDGEPEGRFVPSPRAFFRNFSTYDAPFATKLSMAVRNTLIKIRTHSNCCGHPGEPGC
jgi:hypothetical protein